MRIKVPPSVVEIDTTFAFPTEPYCATPNLPAVVVTKLADEIKQDGFKPGAVVVHIRSKISNRIYPDKWGIIFSIVAGDSKNPIKVKWLNGSWEDCSPEQLRIMIYVPDDKILIQRARANEY